MFHPRDICIIARGYFIPLKNIKTRSGKGKISLHYAIKSELKLHHNLGKKKKKKRY